MSDFADFICPFPSIKKPLPVCEILTQCLTSANLAPFSPVQNVTF